MQGPWGTLHYASTEDYLVYVYDRVVLVTVLGEIPDKLAALQEIFQTLKPGGILSVTEVIFDPHFLSQKTVIKLGTQVGFELTNIYGRRLAYTLHLIKP